LSFWTADVASGEGKEFWRNRKDDKEFTAVNAIRWADADHVVFEAEPQEWTRWYSVRVAPDSSDARPIELTPGDGAVEQSALSADGRSLFYATNAADIERRHIWKVAIAGGAAEQLTRGDTIETYPAVLASGRQVAVLGGDAKRPFGVGLVPSSGNAEYQDVVAAGKYLQSRPDVDPNRVGIWGLSYGGVLTSQALARNSDLFKVGVDLAGVHLWGSSLDPDNASYKASTISAIDTWKSPVLLVHGDDDRNVQFSQTTGLVQLLRAHNVPHELIVFTNDTHEPLLHS